VGGGARGGHGDCGDRGGRASRGGECAPWSGGSGWAGGPHGSPSSPPSEQAACGGGARVSPPCVCASRSSCGWARESRFSSFSGGFWKSIVSKY